MFKYVLLLYLSLFNIAGNNTLLGLMKRSFKALRLLSVQSYQRYTYCIIELPFNRYTKNNSFSRPRTASFLKL